MDRRVRKVTVYVCTDCYAGFPTKMEAQRHWDDSHFEPTPKRPRGRPPKSA
jgi:hypothetical protein